MCSTTSFVSHSSKTSKRSPRQNSAFAPDAPAQRLRPGKNTEKQKGATWSDGSPAWSKRKPLSRTTVFWSSKTHVMFSTSSVEAQLASLMFLLLRRLLWFGLLGLGRPKAGQRGDRSARGESESTDPDSDGFRWSVVSLSSTLSLFRAPKEAFLLYNDIFSHVFVTSFFFGGEGGHCSEEQNGQRL